MNKKILYIVCAALLVINIIITATIGLRVNLYYGEGYTITFTQENKIEMSEIKSIAKEIWGKDFVTRKVEFFNDSVKIKVKEVSNEQVQQLCDKINEKYSSELTVDDFRQEHISNVRILSLVEPYIVPIGISILLVMMYLAIRFRGTKQMLSLLLNVMSLVSIIFTLHAICRLPITEYTVPIFITLYGLIIILSASEWERKEEV